jgi:hypothetical protein
VLIDAVDELAGPSKPLVERFICKVLAREMKVVVFARDAGYDSKVFAPPSPSSTLTQSLTPAPPSPTSPHPQHLSSKVFSFFQRVRLYGLSPEQQQTIVRSIIARAARAASDADVGASAAAAATMSLVSERADHALRSTLELPIHTVMLGDVIVNLPNKNVWDFCLSTLYRRVLDASVSRAVERTERVETMAEEMNADVHDTGVAIIKRSAGPKRVMERRMLVRKALQQIALWLHESHYVWGTSTVVPKGPAVAETAEAAAEAAAEAEAAKAESACAKCAKHTRQFTMSAAKAAGAVDTEALVELELVLALPRRVVAVADAAMLKGMFKGGDNRITAKEAEEKESSDAEYSDDEYSDDDDDDSSEVQ